MPKTKVLTPGVTVTCEWRRYDYAFMISVDRDVAARISFTVNSKCNMIVDSSCDAQGKGTQSGTVVVSPGDRKTVVLCPGPGASGGRFKYSTSWTCLDLATCPTPSSSSEPSPVGSMAMIAKEITASVAAGLANDSLSWSEVLQRGRERRTLFTDDEFRPGPHLQHVAHQSQTHWKRVKDILGTKPMQVLGRIGPNDVTQGQLGDCWLLASFSCLAERPERITKLFSGVTFDSDGIPDVPLSSCYEVNLFTMGLPHRVRIDDYFPCRISSGSPFYASSITNALWVMILEKAFAKMYGSYRALASGWQYEAFHDLTGYPAQKWQLDVLRANRSSADLTWKRLCRYSKENFMMSLSTEGTDKWTEHGMDPKEDAGLVAGHAYSLLSATELKDGRRLVQIRNPWGRFEWKGDWSDSSSTWTPEVERELGLTREQRLSEDGSFWMTYDDLLHHFRDVCFCDTRPLHRLHWKSSFLVDPGSDCRETIRAPAFELKFETTGPHHLWIGIHQEDGRGLGQNEIDIGVSCFQFSNSMWKYPQKKVPKVARDQWLELEFSFSGSFAVFATSTGQVLEKLRLGEEEDECESDKYIPEVPSLFDDTPGTIGPSLALRKALMNIFWRMDLDHDDHLSEAECSIFLARCSCSKEMDTHELLAKFDSTPMGLTKDGFVSACLSMTGATEETMLALLACFGFNDELRLINERPFVLTVHSLAEKPKLFIWPAQHSHTQMFKQYKIESGRPSVVIDPSTYESPASIVAATASGASASASASSGHL
jgi:hypothetical protein